MSYKMTQSYETTYEALQFLFVVWSGCFNDDFHLIQINFNSYLGNPKNFPALMPKAHLAGLGFLLYAHIKKNASSRC